MIVDFSEGTAMKLDGLEASSVILPNGTKAMKMVASPGFDWFKSVQPKMPNCPPSCPATHIGYVVSGKMSCKFLDDGSEETYEAGQTYYVRPGHIPTVHEETVAIEFAPEAHKQMEKITSEEKEE